MIPSTPGIKDGDMTPWSMHDFILWALLILYSNEADGPMSDATMPGPELWLCNSGQVVQTRTHRIVAYVIS